MGISCEINLNTPKSGFFITGAVLSGEIKYAVDKNTVFKKITVSFRGVGKTSIEYKYSQNEKEQSATDYFNERYVDIDKIILDKSKEQEETLFKTGSYTTTFQFNIPNRIPPSVDIYRSDSNHTAKYKVVYYVTIKFQRPGLMNFPKRFKKEIRIASNIIPTLPQNPITLGDRKKLFQLFSRKDSVIDLKATILSSVVKAGDKVQLKYQVENNSNVRIKSVKMKIVETVDFKKSRRTVKFCKDLDESEAKTGSVNIGATQQMVVDVSVPSDALTIDSCKLASREYHLCLIVALPLPHTNLCLKIPLEITPNETENDDQPPSYWDVMCEDKERMDE